MTEGQAKEKYTEREWARSIGIGSVPKDRQYKINEERYEESMKGVNDELD